MRTITMSPNGRLTPPSGGTPAARSRGRNGVRRRGDRVRQRDPAARCRDSPRRCLGVHRRAPCRRRPSPGRHPRGPRAPALRRRPRRLRRLTGHLHQELLVVDRLYFRTLSKARFVSSIATSTASSIGERAEDHVLVAGLDVPGLDVGALQISYVLGLQPQREPTARRMDICNGAESARTGVSHHEVVSGAVPASLGLADLDHDVEVPSGVGVRHERAHRGRLRGRAGRGRHDQSLARLLAPRRSPATAVDRVACWSRVSGGGVPGGRRPGRRRRTRSRRRARPGGGASRARA